MSNPFIGKRRFPFIDYDLPLKYFNYENYLKTKKPIHLKKNEDQCIDCGSKRFLQKCSFCEFSFCENCLQICKDCDVKICELCLVAEEMRFLGDICSNCV
eukprot:TRINITY_DN1686_c0_g1_i1.p1 TRINITY_DN1686_c0_g1~~TRINITY_DN1686_c0_g1_i1.p1  ORF type:complete len:100 (+),score=31.15 TRINITY_DN1686_c0_g1_i1:63-362(+)